MSDSTETVNKDRRRFLISATTVLGGVGAAFAAAPFLGSWFPSTRAEALGSPVELDISHLEPGAQMAVPWRGKPIWVIRRPENMLAGLSALDDMLRDPNSLESLQPSYAKNEYRSIKPEYLVVVGICTHLGCVPSYRPDKGAIDPQWPGGFYCPCHGSKYDLAGRVYKNVPAPTNLVVPPHRYETETRITVGLEEGEKG
jgi:ubiquinol-cytochrome c reductase iron-sulfur subunit